MERFTVPEILFHPSDIGVDEMGLGEGIREAVEACPPAMHPHLYNNIVIIGGNSKFQNFKVCKNHAQLESFVLQILL